MNTLERFIYDIVKKNPKLKQFVRNIYQFLFDLLPRKSESSIAPINYKENLFLGFHDIQPFSKDNNKILCNKNYFDLRMPDSGEKLDVGYVSHKNGILGEFVKLSESFAWNFHKGCRLQWLDDNNVIFNSYIDDRLVSIITSLNNPSDRRILDFPIDTVSKCGKLATSFSYERLEKFMPGYGYPYSDNDSFINDKAPKGTGLFIIDIASGDRVLLTSLKELSVLTNKEEASNISTHYVTHTEFSMDSRYVSFLHRWVGNDKQKRYTKLHVYDLLENKFIPLPITNNMVSHYVWNNKNQIVAYCNFNGVDCHAILDINNPINSHKVAYPELNSDGHQSFVDDNRFVTDTYPDKWRMAKLYLVDISSNSAQLISSVYSPKKFQTLDFNNHIACDLHPRVSSDGKYVCFDTVKSGIRSLAIMSLKGI